MREQLKGDIFTALFPAVSSLFLLMIGFESLYNAYFDYVTAEIKNIIQLNQLLSRFLISFIFILFTLPLFISSYFHYNKHIYGVYVSILYVLSISYLMYVGKSFFFDKIITIICIMSSMFGYMSWKNTLEDVRDNPKHIDNVMNIILKLSSYFGLALLVIIIFYAFIRGAKYVTYEFITSEWNGPRWAAEVIFGVRQGPQGGIASQTIGTLSVLFFTTALTVPFGLCSAIYLAEYAVDNVITSTLNLFIQTLAGIPSVILGLVGFSYFTLYLKWGSCLLSGSITLGFMILPWIIKVCIEAIKSVPNEYREASYALGATKWQTTRFIVFGPAMSGVITGILMGMGKIVGETTILLFTLGNASDKLPESIQLIGHRIPSLTVWINEAFKMIYLPDRPMDTLWEGQNVAFAGALVLITIFLSITFSALLLKNYYHRKSWGDTR